MVLDKRMTIMALSILLAAVLVGLNFEKFTGKYVANRFGNNEVVLSKIYVSTDPSVVKMEMHYFILIPMFPFILDPKCIW